MSRFSDVWIVLSLSVAAAWHRRERIERELVEVVAAVMPAPSTTAHALEIDSANESGEPLPTASTDQVKETFSDGVSWQQLSTDLQPSRCPVLFDCSQAPPGSIIVHDIAPMTGMPVFCWRE